MLLTFIIIWIVSAILAITFIFLVDESFFYIIYSVVPIINTLIVILLISSFLYIIFYPKGAKEKPTLTIKEQRKAKLKKLNKNDRFKKIISKFYNR